MGLRSPASPPEELLFRAARTSVLDNPNSTRKDEACQRVWNGITTLHQIALAGLSAHADGGPAYGAALSPQAALDCLGLAGRTFLARGAPPGFPGRGCDQRGLFCRWGWYYRVLSSDEFDDDIEDRAAANADLWPESQ